MTFKHYFLTTLLTFIYVSARPQLPLNISDEPTDICRILYEETYLKITYNRPHKKGKQVFGDLIPFGEVWGIGTKETCEMTLSKRINFGNHALEAGSYSLLAIPQKKKWAIIVNNQVGMWGSYNYFPAADILRFDVPVQKTDIIYEPLTLNFHGNGKSIELWITWDNTRIAIPIDF